MKIDVNAKDMFNLGRRPWLGLPLSGKRSVRVSTYAALACLDAFCIIGGFVAVGWFCAIEDMNPTLASAIGIVLLYGAIASNSPIYCCEFFENWRRTARRAVTTFVAAAFTFVFITFYLKKGGLLSRVEVIASLAVISGGLIGVRFAAHRLASAILRDGYLAEILICDRAVPPLGSKLLAVDAEALDIRPDTANPASFDRLGRLLKEVDRVVIACSAENREVWADFLKGSSVEGSIIIPELAPLGGLSVSRCGTETTLLVSRGPLDTRNRLLKRLFDLVIAIPVIIVMAPLFAVVAIAIRMDTKGPIFFVQSRLGEGNRMFRIYKFRSMYSGLCDAEGVRSTGRRDERITRVGRLIRRTSIDELPQFLNVLRGEMSIVGPRPHALGSLAGSKLFWEVDQRYWHRHAAKPGITGLAQVRGFRGATPIQSDLVHRLQADLEYLNGWTIWRDVAILFATTTVLFHRNAY